MRRNRESSPAGLVRLLITAVVGLVLLLQSPPVAHASTTVHEQIKGSGSSWAYNSVQQWISDTQTSESLQVVYTPSGSATGRTDFAQGVTDYAVSDIGYQGVNPVTGTDDVSNRPYAYLPIVGGGTAFPYHVAVHGQLVRNIRLSQRVLAEIFTDKITNWNDPQITADNNGRQLPSIPIIPVVHSEGAGTTYQVTDWLNSLFPDLWQPFSGYKFPVEYWPSGKGSQIDLNGSDNVISFVNSTAGQGSIGFDEYSYALQAGLPVVNLQNNGGYYVAPDQYNVAVALTQAQINMDPSSPDYLLQNLSHVWTYNDPRTYPLSSYSYFIEPTAAKDSTMDTGKRQTIVDYLTYSLCQGQAETGPIGYSPLPVNLVQASFQQLDKLHAADSNVSIQNVNVTQCNNPTFDPTNLSRNKLAEIAPQPPACDRTGQGPCVAGTDIVTKNPTSKGTPPPPAVVTTGAQGGSNTTGATSSGGGGGAASAGGSAPTGSGGSGTVAAGSGVATTAGGSALSGASGATTSGSGQYGYASAGSSALGAPVANLAVTTLGADRVGTQWYAIVAAILLMLVVGLPPVVTSIMARRRGMSP